MNDENLAETQRLKVTRSGRVVLLRRRFLQSGAATAGVAAITPLVSRARLVTAQVRPPA